MELLEAIINESQRINSPGYTSPLEMQPRAWNRATWRQSFSNCVSKRPHSLFPLKLNYFVQVRHGVAMGRTPGVIEGLEQEGRGCACWGSSLHSPLWPPGAVRAQLTEGCWSPVWTSAAHAPMWMHLTWKEQAFEGDA